MDVSCDITKKYNIPANFPILWIDPDIYISAITRKLDADSVSYAYSSDYFNINW